MAFRDKDKDEYKANTNGPKYLRPQSCQCMVRENVFFYYFEGKNVQATLFVKLSYLARIPIYHTAILKAHFPHEQFSIKIVVVAQ